MQLQYTTDALLVGIPMVFLFAMIFFRLDELLARPAKMIVRRPLAGGIDSNGMPIFVEPDGKPLGSVRDKPERGHKSASNDLAGSTECKRSDSAVFQ